MLFWCGQIWAQCPILVSNNALNCSGSAVYTIDNYVGNLTAASVTSSSGFSYSGISFNTSAGTFTLSSVSISNYKGFGTFTVTLTIGGSPCVYECKVASCCFGSGSYDYLYVDETIPAGSYSGDILFFGDIGLQGITEFVNADVHSATDARLEILNGASVSANTSTFDQQCDYAWDGFYLSNSTCELTLTSCTIQEAIRAIHTEDNGEVVAVSSTFQDNIVSLYVDAHTSTGPYFSSSISLSGNTFTYTRLFNFFNQDPNSTISLAKFFDGYCSTINSGFSAPIFIDGNSIWVNIGHRTLSQNVFEDPNFYAADITWINIRESQVQIRNNDIDGANMSVCADNNSRVIIGGANPAAGNIIGTPVSIFNSASHIENNTFNSTNVEIFYPIHLLVGTGYPSIGTYIYQNEFNNGRLDVTGNTSSNTQVRIIDNDFPSGYARLYNLAANTNGRLVFNDNFLNGIPGHDHLTVYECHGMVIGNNAINNSSTTTLSGSTTPIGMDLHTLQNAEITKNTIVNCERGIELDGTCTGTEMTCNRFRDNYYGIYLDNPYMSDQGSAGSPLSNEWINFFTKKVAGSSFNTISWHHASALTSDPFHPVPNPPGASNVNFTYTAGSYLNCPSITPPAFKFAGNSNSELTSKESFKEEEFIEPSIEKQENISLFPNPTTGLLNIEMPPTFIGSQIQIQNSSGSIVFKYVILTSKETLDLTKLPPGIYLLRIGDFSSKVIVQ